MKTESYGFVTKLSNLLHAFGQLYQIVVPFHYLLFIHKPLFVLIRMMKRLKDDVYHRTHACEALKNADSDNHIKF